MVNFAVKNHPKVFLVLVQIV